MTTSAFHSLLVPVDGSASADAALRLALRLAAPDGEVLIAHVINRAKIVAECVDPYGTGGDPTPALEALEGDEREIFKRACAQAGAAGVRCSTIPLDGPTAPCIAALVRERKVDAIAMGTHGRRGMARMVLGNTAAGVLHRTALPTFVVHEENAGSAERPFGRILVALDASPAAASAARTAVALAARDGGRVFFAYVAENGEDAGPALSAARAAASAAGVESDAAVLSGDPVEALLVCAQTCHADLIALGAHRRAGLFDMGSVAEAIVRTSPVPVLVVPAPVATPLPEPARPAGATA